MEHQYQGSWGDMQHYFWKIKDIFAAPPKINL